MYRSTSERADGGDDELLERRRGEEGAGDEQQAEAHRVLGGALRQRAEVAGVELADEL